MVRKILLLALTFGLLPGICLYAQEESKPAAEEVAELDLHGVLELFRVAENVEALEKALNKEASEVNNLDLDENGEVDYIRLEEHVEGNIHIIVLQIPLGEKDFQDVATIEIEKLGEDEYTLQIVGNEELYGENYIIEPNADSQNDSARNATMTTIEDGIDEAYQLPLGVSEGLFLEFGPGEPSLGLNGSDVVIVIGALPIVRTMFRPGYRPWISPWRWRRWPAWWRPWKPITRAIHLSRVSKFHHRHWRRVAIRRSVRSRKVYRPLMKSSPKAIKKKVLLKKVKPPKNKVLKKKKPAKKKKK